MSTRARWPASTPCWSAAARWPRTCAREAEARGIRIVQTYGMSETCGGCVYDGRPLDGVEIRIGDDGEVLLRGPVLFDGYEGDPERTAAVAAGRLVPHQRPRARSTTTAGCG